jgi:chromosomal replication initiation ATPase DnaA
VRPQRNWNALADIFSMVFERERDIMAALRVVFEADAAGRRRMKGAKVTAAHIVARAHLRRLELAPDLASRRQMNQAIRTKDAVAAFYGITVTRLVGNQRGGAISIARHVAMGLLRRARFSFPKIADELGCTNHTSAIYGVRKFEQIVTADPTLPARVLGEQREEIAA